MRTERLFLGNETSVNMFDHLFFLHISFVSPFSPSEGLRSRAYSRGRNTEIHHHLEVISVGESSKEKFFNLRPYPLI